MNTISFDKGDVKVIAHRGVSALECENTCAAFVAAGNRSYFGIETDTHVTADGKFVIIHDDFTGNVSNVNISVEGSTREELSKVRLYSGGRVPSYTRCDLVIPDLADYIRICQRYGKIAVLELKNRIATEDIRRMVDEIRELGHLEQTLFISFSWENMVDLRGMLPEQKLQFLISRWEEDLPQRLSEAKLDLDIYYKALTRERIAQLHDLGIEVNCWTCDDPDAAEELVSWGVDYITSNILE